MQLTSEKKIFFNFLGTNFFAPKSGQRREKWPVLQPACIQWLMFFGLVDFWFL